MTELQSKLPLKNELPRQLGCLNPLKKNDGFTVSAVEELSSLLHPKLNTSKVVDEWIMIFQGIMVMNELKSFGMEFLMCYGLVEKRGTSCLV